MTWRLHDGVREAEAQESEVIAAIGGGTLPASTRIRRSDEAEWRALRTHVPFAVALERLREAAPAPQPEPSTEARTPIGHVPYDAEVIRAFAERLYRDAGSMVVSNPIAGGFVGLLFGAIGGHFIGQEGLADVAVALEDLVSELVADEEGEVLIGHARADDDRHDAVEALARRRRRDELTTHDGAAVVEPCARDPRGARRAVGVDAELGVEGGRASL